MPISYGYPGAANAAFGDKVPFTVALGKILHMSEAAERMCLCSYPCCIMMRSNGISSPAVPVEVRAEHQMLSKANELV